MDDEGVDPAVLQKALDDLSYVIVGPGNRARRDDECLLSPLVESVRAWMQQDPPWEPVWIERVVEADILGGRMGVQKLFEVVEQRPQDRERHVFVEPRAGQKENIGSPGVDRARLVLVEERGNRLVREVAVLEVAVSEI